MSSEILAPAGDFSSAIVAYEAGADAVYIGLKDFSARKYSSNFDFSEVRRLVYYAHQNKKKLYVALNTVIENNDISKVIEIIKFLSWCRLDAVIIQDLGVYEIIKKYAPDLDIHASTQMAVHNIEGLKFLKSKGFSRAVLSRETTLSEIKQMRLEVPEIELEVFVHGALCYSFSGLCLASGLMLNRSGNQGACAQICRTYFTSDEKDGLYFSCNDLCLDYDIEKLEAIGVHSLKIEGRMKSKEYIVKTVSMYKSILGKESKNISDKLIIESALTFSRNRTKGYLDSFSGENLIDRKFSGHKGMYLGSVIKTDTSYFQVKIDIDIDINDSVMFIENEKINSAKGFSITAISTLKNKKVMKALKGDTVKIFIKDKSKLPAIATDLFLVSKSDKKIRNVDIKSYDLFREKVDVEFTVNNNYISLKFKSMILSLEKKLDIEIEESKGNDFKDGSVKLLNKKNNSYFEISNVEVLNLSSILNPFVPSSVLKKLKQEFLNDLNILFEQMLLNGEDGIEIKLPDFKANISTRKKLYVGEDKRLPFAYSDDFSNINNFYHENDYYFIPLLPINSFSENYFHKLEDLIKNNLNKKIVLGVNNIHHISYVRDLESYDNVYSFLDFYTYIANDYALKFYQSSLSKILFSYSWIESEKPIDIANNKLVHIADKYELPYFISKGCLKKHNFSKSIDSCSNCTKDFEYSFENNKKEFYGIVKNCHSYLFKSK